MASERYRAKTNSPELKRLDKDFTEAVRLVKRLRPYLTHDWGCDSIQTFGEACSCDYGKLNKRADRLIHIQKNRVKYE